MMITENHERFLNIFDQYVHRDGASALLDWMEKRTDFFEAPASTKFHGACKEGLLIHSLNVYDILKKRNDIEKTDSDETVAICALLHDLCKTNFYKETTRNVKNASGQWEQVPYYSIEDQFPYGHGEKSVYILSGFMKLTRDEAFAIRYHMGFSGPEDANQVGKALEMFPLAFALCVADMEASYYMEGIIKQ